MFYVILLAVFSSPVAIAVTPASVSATPSAAASALQKC